MIEIFGLDRNTISSLVVIIASVLLFNGIVYFGQVGEWFKQYPWLFIIVAVLLLIFKDKISGKLGQ